MGRILLIVLLGVSVLGACSSTGSASSSSASSVAPRVMTEAEAQSLSGVENIRLSL